MEYSIKPKRFGRKENNPLPSKEDNWIIRVCMIGFSIMMWFVSFVILMVAISLLRGNVSTMHGKVFDTTEDKVGYGKQLGKVSLFISIGLCTCGVVAFLIKSSMAIVYALVILLAVIVVSAIWFVFIQKRYMR